MGFRNGSYAKVWEVKPITPNVTRIRISISRKDKQTGQYTQDFSGYVSCLGSNAATAAAALKEGDRIKLGDVDVTTSYDKTKKVGYTDYKMFSFELANRGQSGQKEADSPKTGRSSASSFNEDDLIDLATDEDELPF